MFAREAAREEMARRPSAYLCYSHYYLFVGGRRITERCGAGYALVLGVDDEQDAVAYGGGCGGEADDVAEGLGLGLGLGLGHGAWDEVR